MSKSQSRASSARGTNKPQKSAKSGDDTVDPSKQQDSASQGIELSLSYILSDFDDSKALDYCQKYDNERANIGGKYSEVKFTEKYEKKTASLEDMYDAYLKNIPSITFPSYNITAEYFRFGKVKVGVNGSSSFAKIATQAMFAYYIKKTGDKTAIPAVQAIGGLIQDVMDMKDDIADMKDKIQVVADMKEKIQEVADMKEKIQEVADMKAKIQEVADMKAKIQDVAGMRKDMEEGFEDIKKLLKYFIENSGERITKCQKHTERINRTLKSVAKAFNENQDTSNIDDTWYKNILPKEPKQSESEMD